MHRLVKDVFVLVYMLSLKIRTCFVVGVFFGEKLIYRKFNRHGNSI